MTDLDRFHDALIGFSKTFSFGPSHFGQELMSLVGRGQGFLHAGSLRRCLLVTRMRAAFLLTPVLDEEKLI